MRKNIFERFFEKLFNMPLSIKQVMYLELAEFMKENSCKDFLDNHSDEMFSTYVPDLTYKGDSELTDKKCGLDNNIYNFLEYVKDGFSMIKISVNMFLSMEETAKYFEFCIEQGFLYPPSSKEIQAMTGFLSGKLRTGEFLEQKGIITKEQLQEALEKSSNKKLGETLISLGFVKEQDIKTAIFLKEEAKKRFILDYNDVPEAKTGYADINQKYKEEISALKEENQRLKNKLSQLLRLVKRNA